MFWILLRVGLFQYTLLVYRNVLGFKTRVFVIYGGRGRGKCRTKTLSYRIMYAYFVLLVVDIPKLAMWQMDLVWVVLSVTKSTWFATWLILTEKH